MSISKIKNLEEAADRIKKAVKDRQNIIIYGDSDLDGVASTVILQEAIKNLGGEVAAVVFPDREKDGYGINKRALEFLQDKAPGLFITLDLGISNVAEVDTANDMGFEVIIIDHHQPLEELPRASIVVDPHQKDGGIEFEYLSNGGLTFTLAEAMIENMSESVKNSFLELAALSTISDMVPKIGDNKMIIEEGLRSLRKTFRPGLKAFFEIFGEGELVSGGFSKIISCLNASESTDFRNRSYELLTNTSQKEALAIAQELVGKAQFKQQKIREITEEVERRVAKNPDSLIIFEGDPAWRLTLAGPVASNIAIKYGKPTFIFRRGDEVSVGSVRSLREGENSVVAMAARSDLLISYGGHPKASGFRVKNENLEKFKVSLEEYFRNLRK